MSGVRAFQHAVSATALFTSPVKPKKTAKPKVVRALLERFRFLIRP